MSFASLGLRAEILEALAEKGYQTPTPIQKAAIPAVLQGGDLLAGAQTGTGKTAGFTLPLLERLMQTPARRPGKIRALILAPTRELAAQVEECVRDYSKHLPLSSMVMFGGVGMQPQVQRLRKPLDILVACPGRLLDHAQQGNLDLSGVEVLVLDEADRMLDMGFIHDIRKVLALLPSQRQNLLFSATFSDDIRALANRLLNKPQIIEVARRNTTAESVDQAVYLVDKSRKKDLLAQLIRDNGWFQVLVFTRTKHGANRLAEQLTKGGIPSLAIHGNKSQSARTRALSEFKSGDLQVLVATDIAARGIDITELPHVVNYELPNVAEDYVHRIGRTGRAGAGGEAVSLVCADEVKLLRGIERLIQRSLTRRTMPGFEPGTGDNAPEVDDRPPRPPRGGGRGNGSRGNAAGSSARSSSSASQGESRRERGASTGRATAPAGPRAANGNRAAPTDTGTDAQRRNRRRRRRPAGSGQGTPSGNSLRSS